MPFPMARSPKPNRPRSPRDDCSRCRTVLAATNKSLAQSNKSPARGKATKKRFASDRPTRALPRYMVRCVPLLNCFAPRGLVTFRQSPLELWRGPAVIRGLVDASRYGIKAGGTAIVMTVVGGFWQPLPAHGVMRGRILKHGANTQVRL